MSEQGSYQATAAEPSEYTFARPRRSASEQLAGGATRPPPQVFQPLPQPTGQPPFRLELASVIGPDATNSIEQAGTLVFHAVGDSGGVNSPQPQQIVAIWMDHDYETLQPPPSFFYHLGD